MVLDCPSSRSHWRLFQTKETYPVSSSCFAADSITWELPEIPKSCHNLWDEAWASVVFKALQVISMCSTALVGWEIVWWALTNLLLKWIHRRYQSASFVIRILVYRDRKQMGGCQRLGAMGSDCLMGMGFPLKAVKCFETRQRWWLHNLVNVLIATELYTLKWLDLCYVNFTSMFKKKRILVLGKHVFQFYMCVWQY